MRSNKLVHHPGRDSTNFSTVEDEIESLRNNRVTGPASATDNAVARFDGTTGKLVQNSVVTIADTTGNMAGVGDLSAGGVVAAGGNITKNGGTTVAGVTQTGEWTGLIEYPTDKAYTICINSPFARTITSITTKSSSGTCTFTGKINSTNLGGTANSVSSSESEQTHSTNNAMAAGDDFTLTVSSNSSCQMLSFTVKWTRTLA